MRSLRVVARGRQLLDVHELTVAGGEVGVVLGDAGSGKTVLAAALAGALDSSGEVRVDERLLEGPPSLRRRQGLGVALRDGTRIAGCTVAEALALAAGGSDRRQAALDRFPALATRRDVLAQLLSGGEQQMLQVACAWCAHPRVLVLDSPTVGLAAEAAAAVAALAREVATQGAAVLWLEQDVRAAPVAATHRLRAGRLAAIRAGAAAAESATATE